MPEAAIRAQGLGKSYGEVEAVRGVDFEIHRGECFGFLGPNGAGKTSTMKMIYGSVIPTGGELRVAGVEVRQDEREVKRRLGVVPQENTLDEDLTVGENLEVYGRYFGIGKKVARQRAAELLDFVQLSEKAESRVDQLSGGMKRRLLITRSLMSDPEIVVLDEPTTGLDPQARHLVWDKLRGLTAGGKTLILTTHYMEEAAQLCDRLAIMEDGRIISEGSPTDLVRRHVSPEVLELRAPPMVEERLIPLLKANADTVERDGSSLLAYTRDAAGILDEVQGAGVVPDSFLQRSAGLEDVFLTLTGRTLNER
jgi:lipooligosaccharide transport system ATP-binding protein